MQYVYVNPVFAGLVDDARLYRFSGGFYFDVMLEGRPEGRPYGWIGQ